MQDNLNPVKRRELLGVSIIETPAKDQFIVKIGTQNAQKKNLRILTTRWILHFLKVLRRLVEDRRSMTNIKA